MEIKAKELIRIIDKMNKRFTKYSNFLNILDSVIGDGDHGTNMKAGFHAIMKKIDEPKIISIYDIFETMGNEMIETTGGISGRLYGTSFIKIASIFKEKDKIEITDFEKILLVSINNIRQESGSEIGDKTMLDTLVPAFEEANYGIRNNISIVNILDNVITEARENAAYSILIPAKRDGCTEVDSKSIGYEDAGAISSLIMLEAVLDFYKEQRDIEESIKTIFKN